MTLEQALKRGGHLVVLVDVDVYDAAGAVAATYRLGLGHYAPSRADAPAAVQYLDRVTAGNGRLETNTELGRGSAEVRGELRFANRAGDLAAAGAAMLAAPKAEARLRLGADRGSGLALAELADLGRYRVGAVEVGEEIVLELLDGAQDLRERSIELTRYRGYGYAVDLRPSFPAPPQYFLVAASAALVPVTGVSMGLALYLFTPGSSYLMTLLATPSGPYAAAVGLTPDRTLKSLVRDAGGVVRVVVHEDLVVPLETWVYVEMRWDAASGAIVGMLDGVASEDSLTSASIAAITGGLVVGDQLATSTPSALVTEVRYATTPPELDVLAARALWALPPDAWAEYALYLRTGPVPGAATDRLFDSGPNDLTITAGHDLVFVDTGTGSSGNAGEVIPRAVGLAADVTATSLDDDGRRHGFALGPVRGITSARAGERELWLKVAITVNGTWGTSSFVADPGEPVLSTIRPGQWIRGELSPPAFEKRQVLASTPTAIYFSAGSAAGSGVWTIETVEPFPTQTLSPVYSYHAPNEIRSLNAGAFRYRRAGQQVTVSNVTLNNGTYTVLFDSLPPYKSLFAAEAIVDETPGQTTLTWGEAYDAVADLELGHVVLELGTDEITADVYGNGEATAQGLFRELAGALRTWPNDFGDSIQDLDDPAPMGLLISGDTTVGAELDRVAASLDATWYQHPVTGLLQVVALAAPGAEDVVAREIASSRTLRTWPAVAGLTVNYQRGAVDVGGGGRRADLPKVDTLYAAAEDARARGAAMLALRSLERRAVEIEVPIWAFSWDLLAATLRTAGDPDAVAELWRVLAIAWELPTEVRLTLWR